MVCADTTLHRRSVVALRLAACGSLTSLLVHAGSCDSPGAEIRALQRELEASPTEDEAHDARAAWLEQRREMEARLADAESRGAMAPAGLQSGEARRAACVAAHELPLIHRCVRPLSLPKERGSSCSAFADISSLRRLVSCPNACRLPWLASDSRAAAVFCNIARKNDSRISLQFYLLKAYS